MGIITVRMRHLSNILICVFYSILIPSVRPVYKGSQYADVVKRNNTQSSRTEMYHESSEYRLIKELTRSYNPYVRPVLNSSEAVRVALGLTLTQILDLDEKNQVLTTNVWIETQWFDEKLTWDPDMYQSISNIRIPNNKLWLPDIVLYNSADDYSHGFMPTLAMVWHNGTVFWGPVARFRSSCKIDITYFPFDIQICHIKLGSWAYNGYQVDVTNRSTRIDRSNFIDNGEWELIKDIVIRNVVHYGCCEEPFPDVKFYVFLRRRITYYMMNIIIPCIVLSVLCLAGFLLPPESGEKVNLGLSVLLTLTVFMLMVADKMPQTSESISLIGIYLLFVLLSSCLSVLVAVAVLGLHHQRGKPRPIPNFIKGVAFNVLATVLCVDLRIKHNYRKVSEMDRYLTSRGAVPLEKSKNRNVSENNSESLQILQMDRDGAHDYRSTNKNSNGSPLSDRNIQNDFLALAKLLQEKQNRENADNTILYHWRQVAVVIDRLLFVIFLVITVCCTTGLLIMRPSEVNITNMNT